MKGRLKHLILFVILVLIDQGSKFWVRASLMGNAPIVIIPDILVLQYHENTGAVWGILSGKVKFLTIFTLFVLLFILFIYFKIPEGRRYTAVRLIIVFIIAGAVGNLIDRAFLKYVVDFIYFEIINFPLFNFADTYLTVSSVLLLVLAIFYYKDEDFAFLDNILRIKKKNANKADDVQSPITAEVSKKHIVETDLKDHGEAYEADSNDGGAVIEADSSDGEVFEADVDDDDDDDDDEITTETINSESNDDLDTTDHDDTIEEDNEKDVE